MTSFTGLRRWIALLGVIGLGACNSAPTRPSAVAPSAALESGAQLSAVNGIAEREEFEVCKDYSGPAGPAVTIDVTVDVGANGSIEITSSVQLADGQCAVVHTYAPQFDPQIQRVTVTEQVPAGYTPSYVKSTATLSGTTVGPVVAGNSASGDMITNPKNGFLVVFTNTADEAPPPPEQQNGRFTGGGAQITVGGLRVTRGLTIHCDRLLSNNLEVNWEGNHFHMTDHVTTVACTDDPNIIQRPPRAPLDTLIGVGTGRYNNVDGFTIEFTLVDAGEPGSNDKAALRIYQTSNPGNVVLNLPLQSLTHGNLQAHFDQPHR